MFRALLSPRNPSVLDSSVCPATQVTHGALPFAAALFLRRQRMLTVSPPSPCFVPKTKQNFDFLLNCLLKTQACNESAKPSATCALPGEGKRRDSLSNRQRKRKATALHPSAPLTPLRPPHLKLPRVSWTSQCLFLCHCQQAGGFHPSLPGDATSKLKPPANLKPLSTCGRQDCAHTAVKKRQAAPSRESQAAGRACSAAGLPTPTAGASSPSRSSSIPG